MPGSTGWSSTFGGRPTQLWNPRATFFTMDGNFGFEIAGLTNATVVVVASTNLVNPVWLPVSTNTLSADGSSSFTDLASGSYGRRFYRFGLP
jgi:hypothetical protein